MLGVEPIVDWLSGDRKSYALVIHHRLSAMNRSFGRHIATGVG